MTLNGPADTPNGRLAAERLNLDALQSEATPEIPLQLSDIAIEDALPGFRVEESNLGTAGGSERLSLRLAAEDGRLATVLIQKIPPEVQADAIRRTYALFSAPLNDLQRRESTKVDLLGGLADDSHAIAAHGSFLTIARGASSHRVAETLTGLLFDR